MDADYVRSATVNEQVAKFLEHITGARDLGSLSRVSQKKNFCCSSLPNNAPRNASRTLRHLRGVSRLVGKQLRILHRVPQAFCLQVRMDVQRVNGTLSHMRSLLYSVLHLFSHRRAAFQAIGPHLWLTRGGFPRLCHRIFVS